MDKRLFLTGRISQTVGEAISRILPPARIRFLEFYYRPCLSLSVKAMPAVVEGVWEEKSQYKEPESSKRI